jgi:feruloyl esterase
MLHTRPIAGALIALCAIGLAACHVLPDGGTASPKAATGAPLRACADLAGRFAFASTRIESATDVAEGAVKLGDRPLPAHCVVKGRMHERKGSDGRDYAIGFEMRLPVAWNGRFYYQGNGGLDGAVVPALGALGGGPLTGALMQGFAVISSDAGHTGPQTPFFGLEPQARRDYGYQAVASLTPMAKRLIDTAYGKPPDRSYIGGCSNGGRHVMVAAARVGHEYDGYLAGAPGYRLPFAAVAQIWGVQQWAPLATPGATVRHPMNPNASIADLGSAFTPTERQRVADAILAQCDTLDGAKDGLVQATQACQAHFDPQRDLPTCTGARDGSCLSAGQKQALAAVHAGARGADGRARYSPFPFDPGIAGANWATWKFVNALALDPLALATVMGTPPGPVNPLTDDPAALWARVQAADGAARESGMALMSPPGHERPDNLAPLAARGAKMIVYHGVSDAIFSAEDTRQWVERVDTALQGRGAGFVRYFPVPGMNHCSGGPAADQFDLLAPLVRWVEQGEAPRSVIAQARGAGNAGGVNAEVPAAWSPSRTRPLCAYPAVATYLGSGPLEDAASFACR